MSPRTPLAARTWAFVLVAALAGPSHAQADPSPAAGSLQHSRLQAQRLGDLLDAAQQRLVVCEAQLRAADKALADDSDGNTPRTMQLGLHALSLQRDCEGIEQDLQTLRQQRSWAARELRLLAAAQKGLPAPPGGAPQASALALVGTAAAEAKPTEPHLVQAQVSTLRAASTGTLPASDAAVKLALNATIQWATDVAADVSGLAAQSRADALEVRRSLTLAQRAANHATSAALPVTQCQRTPEKLGCSAPELAKLRGDASKAIENFDKQIAVAKNYNDRALDAALQVTASTEAHSPQERAILVRFLKIINTNPDAKSLVGGDAARLSASSAGGSASVKLVWDSAGLSWARGTSLTLSTPAGTGSTRVLSTDGLANATTLQIAGFSTRGRLPLLGSDSTVVQQFGWALGTGYERVAFIDEARAAKTGLLRPLSVSGYLALADVPESETGQGGNMHLFRLTAMRAPESGEPGIRCALPGTGDTVIGCVTGPLGRPSMTYSREFSYEYRLRTAAADFWPRVSYNDVSHLKEFNLPIYFIRPSGDKGAQAFNAGVNLKWTSQGKGSVGVFVGTPLNLFSVEP